MATVVHAYSLCVLSAIVSSLALSLELPTTSLSMGSSSFGSVISNPDSSFIWDKTNFVYAFGDSYSFVQGTRGLGNFSFIGDFQNISFTKKELLSDEIIFRNTSSNGANWLEFLTKCFSGRPLDCSRQLWDFAFAGADVDGNLTSVNGSSVKQWATYASDFLSHPSARTLTAWWIGINDTGDSLNNATIIDFREFFEREMNSLFSAVELAYTTGLRGAHLFLTIPPTERTPSSLGSASAPTLQAHVEEYNAFLVQYVQAFANSHTDTSVLVFDAHGWFNYALDNAAALGFTNITGFCECDETGFFWFNSGHPTELTHRLMANALNDFLSGISA